MQFNLLVIFIVLGGLAAAAMDYAQAQQVNPVPPPSVQSPDQGTAALSAPSVVPKSGVVKPPDVDPAMSKPVPNIDPGIDKPPAGVVKPGTTPPKTPPDVQPR